MPPVCTRTSVRRVRTNEHGQQVGEPLGEWAGARRPEPLTLEGRWVRLEPVGPGHVPALFEYLRGPAHDELWTYRGDAAPMSLDEAAVAFAPGLPDRLTFAVVPLDAGEARGVSSLVRIDPVNGTIEIGAVLYARSMQRSPAGTEATYLLARHVFEDLGYRRLEWKLDSGNEPSARAAERLGFSYEGRHRQAVAYKGRNRDTDWFSMLDSEWPAVRARLEAWLDPANFDDEGRQRRPLARG